MTTLEQPHPRWQSAWPDALAFCSVLAVAWWSRASATDLVWSLWLSSLVVGYAIIVWTIVGPVIAGGVVAWRHRSVVAEAIEQAGPRTTAAVVVIALLFGLFLLAFFTVHFVGFHYVHAGFLGQFFPLGGDYSGSAALRGAPMFAEVARRYWVFLPSAFLAERAAFLRRPEPVRPADLSVTVEAIAARKAAKLHAPPPRMLMPYQKVMRMHGLIFFFAFAHFARLDNFAVYAVVYAAYFFPWRLLRRPEAAAQPTTA